MAYEALRHYARRDLAFRFVSNVDPTDFVEATRDLAPEETLFIVSSKTFTTVETTTNARAAREWCLAALGDEAAIRATSWPCRPTISIRSTTRIELICACRARLAWSSMGCFHAPEILVARGGQVDRIKPP